MSTAVPLPALSSAALPLLNIPENHVAKRPRLRAALPWLVLATGIGVLFQRGVPMLPLASVALASALIGLWFEKQGAWLFFRAALAFVIWGGILSVSGSGSDYDVIWFYAVPPAAYFFFGHREGTLWSLGTLTFWALHGLLIAGPEAQPEAGMWIRFVVSYAIATILAYEVEWRRRRYMRRLIEETEALRQAVAQVETLQGFLPICASCKSVRDDQGFWKGIGAYLEQHSMAQIDQALCPECRQERGSGWMPSLGEEDGVTGDPR